MRSNLRQAIIEFLANEFKLDPKSLGEDINFQTDLNLDEDGLADLLQRLQDALDFTLPEDKVNQIDSVEDLFHAIDLAPDSEP